MLKRPIAMVALSALMLVACGQRALIVPATPVGPVVSPSMAPVPVPPPVKDDDAPWDPPGDSTYTPRWTTNDVRLYVDGPEIFPAMEALLQRATKLIQIDYYIFSGKQAGRIAEILKAKAKSGVTVEMMLDPNLGVLPELKNASQPIVKDLLANGVKLKLYPLKLLRSQVGKDRIVDHSKVIVVDGREAMVGGMNLANPFLANHDLMVELRGEAARDLGQNLRHDYRKADTFSTKALAFADPAQVRVNATGLSRTYNKEAVLSAIQKATSTCYVLMFQLTHDEVISALIDARKRGVDVRVILDPGVHDDLIPFIKKAPRGFPNLPAALQLKAAGVPVKWYRLKPDMDHMHAKSAVIDQATCFVGSTNWTFNGFANNNETSLEITGGSAPGRLHAVFLQDWEKQSEEVMDDQKALANLKAWIVRQVYFP
jgi:cardiolipin synthase